MNTFNYQWWVYIVLCADQSFYVGFTTNLADRIDQHNTGLGANYTSTRYPVRLVWSKSFTNEYDARVAEKRIKAWSRSKKHALIQGKIYSE